MSWSLISFFAVNFLAALSGGIFSPDGWFRSLKKPSWQPPDWAFPVVWVVLYGLNSFAGWLVYMQVGFEGVGLWAFSIYGLSLVFNAAWSALFFGAKRMDLSLWDAGILWASVALQMVVFWTIMPIAGALCLPYLAWVSVAFVLNRTVWHMNPDAMSDAYKEGVK